jgi:hypothetical protein
VHVHVIKIKSYRIQQKAASRQSAAIQLYYRLTGSLFLLHEGGLQALEVLDVNDGDMRVKLVGGILILVTLAVKEHAHLKGSEEAK